MSGKRKKPFVSRWKPSTKTFEIAAAGVARIDPATAKTLAESLWKAFESLTKSEKAAKSLNDLRLAALVSMRIERLGVIKGLTPILDAAFEAIEGMRERSTVTGTWSYSPPNDDELKAINELCECHAFQLSHLTNREFKVVFQQANEDLKRLPEIHV